MLPAGGATRSGAASLSFKRWEALSRLSADFKATAENYARVIVMERHLPDGEKTVKRLSGLEGGGGGDGAGFSLGAAGGEKYLVAGIYFKFCIDDKGIYGGSASERNGGDGTSASGGGGGGGGALGFGGGGGMDGMGIGGLPEGSCWQRRRRWWRRWGVELAVGRTAEEHAQKVGNHELRNANAIVAASRSRRVYNDDDDDDDDDDNDSDGFHEGKKGRRKV